MAVDQQQHPGDVRGGEGVKRTAINPGTSTLKRTPFPRTVPFEGDRTPLARRRLSPVSSGRATGGEMGRDLGPEWRAASTEKRFTRAIKEGLVPEARPDLGPCLIYTGGKNDRGYGQFRYNGRGDYAHRYAWERVNGPIPEGLTIDHLCFVRACVRLEHLEVVDGATNTRRAAEARNRCRNGHLYGEDNEAASPRRRCAKCDAATRARSERKRRRLENGLPDRRVQFDQQQVDEVVARVLAAEITIVQGAREIGCNDNYLGRRAWNTAKKAVFMRDDGRCVCCGSAAVDVQHRIRRGSGGSRDPKIAYGMSNLIALCRHCHDIAEARDEYMRAMGMWLNTWQKPELEPVMLHSEHGPGVRVWLGAQGGYLLEAPEVAA